MPDESKTRDELTQPSAMLQQGMTWYTLGTYNTLEKALIARDVCTFHTEEQLKHEHFNYKCSPELFATLPPLSVDFRSIDPRCKGQHLAYNKLMRERISFWIDKDEEFNWTGCGPRVSDDKDNASTSQAVDGTLEPSISEWELNIGNLPSLDILPDSYPDVSQNVPDEPVTAEGQQDYCQQSTPDLTGTLDELIRDPDTGEMILPDSVFSDPSGQMILPFPDCFVDLEVDVNDLYNLENGYFEELCAANSGKSELSFDVVNLDALCQFSHNVKPFPEGKCTPVLLDSNTYDTPFSDHPSEVTGTEMPEDPPTDLYDHDWMARPDLEDTKEYKLRSKELEAFVCNIPSHVPWYNCGDLIPGSTTEADDLLLGTGIIYPALVPPPLVPSLATTAKEVTAAGDGLAWCELTVSDDINPHEGGQSHALDAVFKTVGEGGEKSM